jgi:hypothetical protein
MRRVLRNGLWSTAVLAVISALGLGLPAVNAALPAGRPIKTGQPYPVGAGVRVIPPPGAMLDVTKTVPSPDRGTALFLLCGVRYLVVAAPFAGTLEEAAKALREKITANRGYQVASAQVAVRTTAGVAGWQGGYVSPGRDGRYAVFLSGGTAVQITFAGGDLELNQRLPVLEASVASIAFGPA